MVTVTSANIGSSQDQANSVKHTKVHHGALAQAGTVASKKAKKKSSATSKKAVTKSDKKSKSSKLRPQKDISSVTSRASRSPDDQSNAASKGSGLFSTWGGDALSLFMFKVAPLIMKINFSLRTVLSQAQQTEVENQIKSANLSAQFTMQKGEKEASQLRLQGDSAIAGGITGIAGMGQGALELGSANGTMEDELAFQDKVMNDLSVSKEVAPTDEPTGRGDIEGSDNDLIEETPAPRTPEKIAEQKASARELAKKYKAAREAKAKPLQEAAEAKGDSFKDKVAKSKRFGLGKKDAQIKLERNIEISKSAGADTFKEISSTDEGAATLENIYKNPDVAAEFMDELGSSLGQPDAALEELRGMPRESTGKILRSFGKTPEAEAFKAKVENTRTNVTSRMAAHEESVMTKAFNKRQMTLQTVQGLSGGATNLLSVSQKIDAASAESQATMANAEASVMASVRGAQDGAISGAIDQVRGLMEWYAQMESQVIGAVSQSMA